MENSVTIRVSVDDKLINHKGVIPARKGAATKSLRQEDALPIGVRGRIKSSSGGPTAPALGNKGVIRANHNSIRIM